MKRQWIEEHGPPRLIFGDVAKLGQGECHDFRSGERRAVPPCDICFAGFSCKNLSSMNQDAHKYHSDGGLRNEQGTSGTTLHGILNWLEQCRKPKVVIIENVPSFLTKSDHFAFFQEKVHSLGYSVMASIIDAKEYGLPQQRQRAWATLYRDDGVQSELTDADLSEASSLLQAYVVPKTLAFTAEDIVWPADSEDFKYWSQEFIAKKHIRKSGKLERWPGKHAKVYRAAGLEWPPKQSPNPSNEFTRKLNRQRLEILLYDEARHSRSEFSTRFIALGQSLGRQSERSESFPTIVPNSALWERSRQSPVWGLEMLEVQGMDRCMAHRARRFKNMMLVDLAGSRKLSTALPATIL